MYRVTGFVKGQGKIEKTIVASSAKEAAEFFKQQLGTKVSVTVVSVIMEAEAKKIEAEEETREDNTDD